MTTTVCPFRRYRASSDVVVATAMSRQARRFALLNDRQAVVRDDELDHPDAAAQRRARGENGRAGHPLRAADDRELLSRSLMRGRRDRPGSRRYPMLIDEQRRAVDREPSCAPEPDVDDDDDRPQRSAIHHVPALDRREGQREVAAVTTPSAATPDVASRPLATSRATMVAPRWRSAFAAIDRRRRSRRAARRCARCRADRRRRGVRRGRAPPRHLAGHERACASSNSRASDLSAMRVSGFRRDRLDDADADPGGRERARDDPCVAAIVPGAGENEDARESSRSRKRSAISAAAAAPARCMSARDGTPARDRRRVARRRLRAGDDADERTHGFAVTRRLFLRGADGAAVTQLAVVDADIEPAFRIAARPGLVGDRRTVTAVVAQREQGSGVALAARGPFDRSLHVPLLPSPRRPTRRKPRRAYPLRLALY